MHMPLHSSNHSHTRHYLPRKGNTASTVSTFPVYRDYCQGEWMGLQFQRGVLQLQLLSAEYTAH